MTTLNLAGIDRFSRAELRFEGLLPPDQSFEIRVFLNEPGASSKTPTEGNPHYVGSQYFYGVGSTSTVGDATERAQQRVPTQIPLNITAGLQAFLAQTCAKEGVVTLVAVDPAGREIQEPELRFEKLSLALS